MQDRVTVRHWFARRLVTGIVALLASFAAAAAPAPERTLLADPPRPIADFRLTDQSGKPVTLADLRGAPALVFFGFTHCSSVCPAALHKLRELERLHRAELGKTRIVIISVDGERDTPQAMAAWLAPMSRNFIGLTGAPARVRDIAAGFSAAFFKEPASASGEYEVQHNSQIFLLDAKGRLRATFFDAPVTAMAQVTQTVAAERG